jgi:hypothetical protein
VVALADHGIEHLGVDKGVLRTGATFIRLERMLRP